MPRKKIKDGKIISLYLSRETIQKACLINWSEGNLFINNKSAFIEKLILEEFKKWEESKKKGA